MRHEQSVMLLETLTKMGKIGRYMPDVDELPKGAFFMLYRIRKCAGEVMEEARGEGVKVSTLSTRSRVSMPAVSKALRDLESRGLIERRMAANDRRVVRVTLTRRGDDLLNDLVDEFIQMVDRIIDRLGEKDTQQLVALLNRFYAVLEDDAIRGFPSDQKHDTRSHILNGNRER